MAALNSTVASVSARECIFILTEVTARTGKICRGGGEAGSRVLGTYDRDGFNENGKLLPGFAVDNKLDLLSLFFRSPKRGVSYTF